MTNHSYKHNRNMYVTNMYAMALIKGVRISIVLKFLNKLSFEIRYDESQ